MSYSKCKNARTAVILRVDNGCVCGVDKLWSSKERKKTGQFGHHISEGAVKEIERELSISKWGNFV